MFANILLGILSGAMLAASFPMSFAPGGAQWSLPWLAFIAPVPLFFALRRAANVRQAYVIGTVAGFTLNIIGLFWIISFGVFALTLLAGYQALIFGLFCIVLHILLRFPAEKHNFILIPGAWAGMEYLHSWGTTGFPWLFLGYTQYNNAPVVQLSAIGGVYASSFFVALAAYALFHLLGSRMPASVRMRGVALATIALAVMYGWGYYALIATSRAELEMPTARVAVVQGGLASDSPWSAEDYISAAHNAYVGATRMMLQGEGSSPDLVVWPEGALPSAINQRLPQPDDVVQQLWADNPALCLLMGSLSVSDRGLENSAFLYSNPYAPDGFYSKTRLVGFGEFVPLSPAARLLNYPWGDQDLVEGYSLKPLRFGRNMVAANVCYDSIYPTVSREGVRKGATLIAVIANNSWYKLPSGSTQHAMMDYFRAVENRRSLVRAATTGISGFILPSGRQVTRIERNINAWKVEVLPMNETLSLYARIGDAFAVILLILAAVGFAYRSLVGTGEEMA